MNSLINLLLNLCCSSTVATQHLLHPRNRLASTLATILLYWGDENTLASVYRLIKLIILILGGEEYRVAERRRTHRRRSTRISAGDESEAAQPEFFTWERLTKYRAAVEAIKNHNIGAFLYYQMFPFLSFMRVCSRYCCHSSTFRRLVHQFKIGCTILHNHTLLLYFSLLPHVVRATLTQHLTSN